jgi:hypothetical protein
MGFGLRPVRLPPLAPAPPKPAPIFTPRVTFFDLPAELRIEIYRLALENVIIHILPVASPNDKLPHALTRTSRQVRNEVLPLMHSICPIRSSVTEFNFDGLLLWMSRVPPHEEANLKKNPDMRIFFTTNNQPQRSMDSLRKWLHMRADKYRPQPQWQYSGTTPNNKVCADLRRRTKRMKEARKQKEMVKILKALNVTPPPDLLPDEDQPQASTSQTGPAATRDQENAASTT